MPDAAPQCKQMERKQMECKQMQRKRRDGAGGRVEEMAGALAVAIALSVTPGLVPGVQGAARTGGRGHAEAWIAATSAGMTA